MTNLYPFVLIIILLVKIALLFCSHFKERDRDCFFSALFWQAISILSWLAGFLWAVGSPSLWVWAQAFFALLQFELIFPEWVRIMHNVSGYVIILPILICCSSNSTGTLLVTGWVKFLISPSSLQVAFLHQLQSALCSKALLAHFCIAGPWHDC